MRDHHARFHRAWVVVELIDKGAARPGGRARESVVDWCGGAGRACGQAAGEAHDARGSRGTRGRKFDRSTRRGLTRRDLKQRAPQSAGRGKQ
jgi:hypothetical protein